MITLALPVVLLLPLCLDELHAELLEFLAKRIIVRRPLVREVIHLDGQRRPTISLKPDRPDDALECVGVTSYHDDATTSVCSLQLLWYTIHRLIGVSTHVLYQSHTCVVDRRAVHAAPDVGRLLHHVRVQLLFDV
jgi:hypothetical protein